MITTADFPQADRLNQVGLVAEAISKGHHTDDGIEHYIGLDSGGRQGRYYRRAAVVLGLIANDQNFSILTTLGQEYAMLATEAARTDFLARCLVDTPVFHRALQYILTVSPNEMQLKAWFRQFYPGLNGTADRRFSTFMNYLRDARLVDYAMGVYKLSKFSGSVTKQLQIPGKNSIGSKKPLIPSTPPGQPPAATAKGIIQIDVDSQKLERANQTHWKLIDAKSSFLSDRGLVPHEHIQIDLFCENNEDFIFYEMKSINDQGTNLLSQLRKAVSQLYEYRFIYDQPSARLCIVTNQGVTSKDEWLLNYLAKDRAIAYEWTEDFHSFQSRADSRLLTGSFSP